MNQIVRTNGNGHPPDDAAIEAALVRGDLSKLTPAQKTSYYNAVCNSLGLNPLTQPFAFIVLNGKEQLYPKRDCTDQLRKLHKISVTDVTAAEEDGVFIVKCKVSDATGRTDMGTGAVHVGGLKGVDKANAVMKAETKAKRRATLSICGLGFTDESELDDIPTEAKRQNPHVTRADDIVDAPQGETIPEGDAAIKVLPKGATRAEFERAQKEMYAIDDPVKLDAWAKANANRFQIFHPDHKQILRGLYAAHRSTLVNKPAGGEATLMAQQPETPADRAERILSGITDPGMLERAYDYEIEPILTDLDKDQQEEVLGVYRKHERRLAP